MMLSRFSPASLPVAPAVTAPAMRLVTINVSSVPAGATVQDGDAVVLRVFARQRFGSDDFGVNAARLRDWLARLGVD